MNNQTMLLSINKKNNKKSRFYLDRIKSVKEDDEKYYFVQEDARIVTLQWKLKK